MPPGARCASCSGYGRPCYSAAQVPAFLRERGGASVSVPRQSAPTSSCASEACTRSANCALDGDSTVQFFDFVYVLRARCCALTGAGDGPDSAEIREVSACVLGHGC